LYALGWDISTYRGHQIISHGGAVTGFGSIMAYIPERSWGVTIFGNSLSASLAIDVLLFRLLDGLFEVPHEESYDWIKHHDSGKARGSHVWHNARKFLYPEAPSRPLNHTFPLEAYAGVYTHIPVIEI